ncbi:putative oxidase (copper-binding protein) [Marmoricola endophyticus]|uniref:Oxidase (Copper-binding protein) n=1 Tax=Marmoricola endophyticus TaxID=2040280 RepID=A0A917BRH4_9ACTN|nr:putative oxidase (copper-binding protein) [Marmoricola endophyticus]
MLAVAGGATALALARDGVDRIGPRSPEVAAAERARARSGRTVSRRLTAAPGTVDLAGRSARTTVYDGALPGREIRAAVGDRLRITMTNGLDDPTTVHWHGLALRNDMDGVPDVTMTPTAPGATTTYDFAVPHAGTYWYHPHVELQRDGGLSGPLVVEDPDEPLSYDEDVVLHLDDWTDGVGRSPQANLEDLARNGMGDMGGMEMSSDGGVDATHPLGTDTGDVAYPLHLVNGRPPADPYVVSTRPGRRIRFRLVNAGGDTAYRVAIGGHRMTVVASDGFPVEPVEVDALVIGMAERYDVLVTAGDGAFPIDVVPEGKEDPPARAVLRSASGVTPAAGAAGPAGRLLTYADLRPTEAVALRARKPDATLPVVLRMVRGGRTWTINDKTYDEHEPLDVLSGQRVRLVLDNRTTMFHPMHLHGHTYAVVSGGRPGVRKDTVNVLPGQRLAVDLDTDNPGQWLLHCHNLYHGALGMMTVVSYVR